MRCRAVAAVALAAVAAVAAPAAGAKEGVEAMLLSSLPQDAAPGTTVRVRWRLADPAGHPFGAGGIFVKLVGARGASTTAAAEETAAGLYVASATVPRGGIRRGRGVAWRG